MSVKRPPRTLVVCIATAVAAAWLASGCQRHAAVTPATTPRASAAPAPAATGRAAARHPPAEVHYHVSVDAALSRLDVRVCFAGQAPTTLRCTAAEGAGAVADARLLGQQPRGLRHDAHHMFLDDVPSDACIGYTVDLTRLPAEQHLQAERGKAVWLKSGEWLWRPSGSLDGVRVTASFVLPDGITPSVPWSATAEGHVLDPSVFAFKSYVALGALEHERIERPDGALRVAILPGFSPATRAAIRPWLDLQARAVALGGAGFPARSVQVLVVPTGSYGQPVHFGTALRGGGASLVLFVARDADPASLNADWVAVHELSHLRLPFLSRRDAWLSEGFATYQQEVLRVRAGLLEPHVAWTRLYQGAALRYGADQSLADESEQMSWKHNYPLVYWAGAAFALLADVALRERSAGRQTLDTVLAEINRCCAVSERPWNAKRLIERLDQVAGVPLFAELYEQRVLSPELPELGALYARLGVAVSDGKAVLAPKAELSWVRDAIMAPPSP